MLNFQKPRCKKNQAAKFQQLTQPKPNIAPQAA